jgi:TorA maturation chaperone TorD
LDVTRDDRASEAGALGSRDAARARSNGYAFLAELLAGDLTQDKVEQATRVLSEEPPLSLDELGAAHYELFGMQVFPHSGVFLDSAALAGGDRVADMVERYQRWGFSCGTSEGQDHIACQLEFLAWLIPFESRFRSSGDDAKAQLVLDELRSFLDAHLLPWIVPLLAAVRAAHAPLFSAAMEIAVQIAADHRRELGGHSEMAGPAEGPNAAEILENPRTSVRDIAEFLLAPSRSGCWISRADIQRLGRGSDVPRGFGSRAQLLSNLLRNAAEYELAEDLLGQIDALLVKQAQSYTSIAEELGLAAFAAPWLERISATREMIGAMAEALPLASDVEEEQT